MVLGVHSAATSYICSQSHKYLIILTSSSPSESDSALGTEESTNITQNMAPSDAITTPCPYEALQINEGRHCKAKYLFLSQKPSESLACLAQNKPRVTSKSN
jgi:hypothetical protein